MYRTHLIRGGYRRLGRLLLREFRLSQRRELSLGEELRRFLRGSLFDRERGGGGLRFRALRVRGRRRDVVLVRGFPRGRRGRRRRSAATLPLTFILTNCQELTEL